MNGFERRKEKTKDRIRRAALDLFKAHGIKKVGLNDVAGKAGVSPVTIYNRFGSKDELVRDVVKTLILDSLERYRALMEGEQPFLEKLELILFEKSETTRQYHGELLQSVFSTDPELQQFFEVVFQREIRQVQLEFLEEGRRQGYVNAEVSLDVILLYLDIMRSGMVGHFALSADSEYNLKLVREFYSLFLHGLMGKAG